VEQTPVREAVGNGEPPKPTQSEPIDHPAKKQHHTERNKQPQCRTSEGVFAPRWHMNLPFGLVPRAATRWRLRQSSRGLRQRPWLSTYRAKAGQAGGKACEDGGRNGFQLAPHA